MSSIFHQQSQPVRSLVSLSPREAFGYLHENAAILDIRSEYETNFRVFDVPQIYYLPYYSYHDKLNVIPRDMFMIVADSVGNRSTEVARYMLEQGYSRVACLAGGVVEWDRAGLPLSKDLDYEMVGGCACKLRPQKALKEVSAVAPK